MKRTLLSIAVLAVFYLGLYARGRDEVKPAINGPSEVTLRSIATSDEKERLEILRELSKGRSDLEARLLKELGAATEDDKKFAFVYLMGLYRLEATVWTLANIIDLESKPTWNDKLPLWGRHPAAGALLKIGRRAIPAMLDNIKTAKREKITRLSVWVIQHIETPAITKMILEEAIAEEKDPTKNANLRNSLKYWNMQGFGD